MACITLLSDFGLQDASVAVAKGVLMQHSAGMSVIDISHEVRPFHTGQAAYLLSSAWRHFPAGTCHVLLFNLFSEKITRVLLAQHDGHYFITSDNGLLPMALATTPTAWLAQELLPTETFPQWLHAAGQLIGRLQSIDGTAMGLAPYQLRAIPQPSLQLKDNEVSLDVLHIDHYENVALNITRPQFEDYRRGRNFRLQFAQIEEIGEIGDSYAAVRPGQRLARFNSNGYMEICVNRGNAASLFGLRLGGRNNDIKIIFE
jgi:S-adenosylmethionine hydrolase